MFILATIRVTDFVHDGPKSKPLSRIIINRIKNRLCGYISHKV